jgi:Ca2+-binding RTX toxin-like protein
MSAPLPPLIRIIGGSGNDRIKGGSGADRLIGGAGDDRIKGGSGADILSGGSGNDRLQGGDDDDLLRGGAGDDLLIGDAGADTMRGGAGNDRMVWNPGDGSDIMRGGAGIDTAIANGGDIDETFTLKQQGRRALFDRVDPFPFTLDINSTEVIELNAAGGNDSFAIEDLSNTAVTQVVFNGGDGDDTLDATATNVQIIADGGSGNDLLMGGSAIDTFFAGAGNDVVIGQRGDDIADLGEGDDRFIWNNGDGSDFINGGAGFDVTQVNGADGAGDEFDLQQVNGQAIFNRFNLGLFTLTNEEIEQFEINGQGGDDSLTVGDLTGSAVQSVVFSGGDGNDFLNASGTSTPVTADGGAGDDILIGGAGDDILIGGGGADLLIGGGGNDILIGGSDTFRVGFDTGAAFNAADIGIDQIQNFGATDSIVLDVTVFTELTSAIGGPLSASEFAVVNSAEEAALSDALIVYGANSGELYYNANGTEAGFGDGAQFATIQGAPELDATNFVIQA